MNRWAKTGVATACIMLAFACDEQTEVQRQTHELEEAQKSVAKVTEQLATDLDKAKGDVARLEQKLAMARQGLTDVVFENQRELHDALKAQEHKVETELKEATHEAEVHSRDTEVALRTLGQTAGGNAMPPREELVPVHGGPEPGYAGADAGSEATRVPAPPPSGTENASPASAPPPVPPAPSVPVPSAPPPVPPAAAAPAAPEPAPAPPPEPALAEPAPTPPAP